MARFVRRNTDGSGGVRGIGSVREAYYLGFRVVVIGQIACYLFNLHVVNSVLIEHHASRLITCHAALCRCLCIFIEGGLYHALCY